MLPETAQTSLFPTASVGRGGQRLVAAGLDVRPRADPPALPDVQDVEGPQPAALAVELDLQVEEPATAAGGSRPDRLTTSPRSREDGVGAGWRSGRRRRAASGGPPRPTMAEPSSGWTESVSPMPASARQLRGRRWVAHVHAEVGVAAAAECPGIDPPLADQHDLWAPGCRRARPPGGCTSGTSTSQACWLDRPRMGTSRQPRRGAGRSHQVPRTRGPRPREAPRHPPRREIAPPPRGHWHPGRPWPPGPAARGGRACRAADRPAVLSRDRPACLRRRVRRGRAARPADRLRPARRHSPWEVPPTGDGEASVATGPGGGDRRPHEEERHEPAGEDALQRHRPTFTFTVADVL